MSRLPPMSKRPYTLFPYTALFRSAVRVQQHLDHLRIFERFRDLLPHGSAQHANAALSGFIARQTVDAFHAIPSPLPSFPTGAASSDGPISSWISRTRLRPRWM